MKFLPITIVLFLSAFFATAQNRSLPTPSGKPVQVMTSAEANVLNGTADPIINGMPYSQYKAQQDAMKSAPVSQPQRAGIPVQQAAPGADAAVGRKNSVAPADPAATAVRASAPEVAPVALTRLGGEVTAPAPQQ